MALLTTRDVQQIIRVDRSTIYRMAEDGRIPAVKVGRQWRFPEDELRAWLGSGQEGAASRQGDPEPDGDLASLVPAPSLQALADFAGEVLGVMVVITEVDGTPLTTVANPCGLFRAVNRYPGSLEHCIAGWREYAEAVDLAPSFAPSHSGFLCARAFVRVGSGLAGMVIVGGVRPESWPPAGEELDRLAEELGVPGEALSAHVEEVYDLTEAERHRVLSALPRMADLVSHLAQDHGRLVDRLDSIAALATLPERRSTM